MTVITGRHPIGKDLCTALGLDPSFVHGITINVAPNSAVSAEVVVYLNEEQAGEIVEIVRKYRAQLVEVAE
jgi:hypothetical protein